MLKGRAREREASILDFWSFPASTLAYSIKDLPGIIRMGMSSGV